MLRAWRRRIRLQVSFVLQVLPDGENADLRLLVTKRS